MMLYCFSSFGMNCHYLLSCLLVLVTCRILAAYIKNTHYGHTATVLIANADMPVCPLFGLVPPPVAIVMPLPDKPTDHPVNKKRRSVWTSFFLVLLAVCKFYIRYCDEMLSLLMMRLMVSAKRPAIVSCFTLEHLPLKGMESVNTISSSTEFSIRSQAGPLITQ